MSFAIFLNSFSLLHSNDKTVWVWSFDVNKDPKLAPEVKYSHSDKVYCLSFNPLTH